MQGLDSYQRPHWESIDHAIEMWLAQRQELLVAYYALCQLSPFEDQTATHESLTPFLEILLDYVSAGHFEIFEKLAEAHSKMPEDTALGLDRNLYVAILKTTMEALEFNDRHQKAQTLVHLKAELSQLGEALAQRLDLEDQLITTYLKASKKLQES